MEGNWRGLKPNLCSLGGKANVACCSGCLFLGSSFTGMAVAEEEPKTVLGRLGWGCGWDSGTLTGAGVSVRPSLAVGVVEATTGAVVVVVVARYSRTGVVLATTTGAVLSAGLGLEPKVVWTELSWGAREGSGGLTVGLKRGPEGNLTRGLGGRLGVLGPVGTGAVGLVGTGLLGRLGSTLLEVIGGMLLGRMEGMLVGRMGAGMTGFSFLFPIWKN